ncbi:MAG: hypothetical protein ACFFDT_40460, partial [Candidatus Hodarchaeota archaeon]
MRKIHILILILLACVLNNSNLESHETLDSEIQQLCKDFPSDIFSGNFAVPDAPAFRLLETYPSKILRPSGVRDLALGLSDFWESDSNFTLPRLFAVEFSPVLLGRGKYLALSDYQKNSWIYRTRISAAIHRLNEESAATKVAIGIRTSLIDESDLRNDISYISEATNIAEEINTIYTTARKRAGPPPSKLELTSKEEKQIEEFISDYKKIQENKKWNKRVLEFAIA